MVRVKGTDSCSILSPFFWREKNPLTNDPLGEDIGGSKLFYPLLFSSSVLLGCCLLFFRSKPCSNKRESFSRKNHPQFPPNVTSFTQGTAPLFIRKVEKRIFIVVIIAVLHKERYTMGLIYVKFLRSVKYWKPWEKVDFWGSNVLLGKFHNFLITSR